ncbi:ArsC family reductase [Shewanella inventionis]|uniref:Arsenate reductase n=1 Tax=Shewanella inventionis TaxID=1738770 RepID=A0ABQ1J321_9GAMM|nr:ArsC family reductase [Shewanella inventionis]MCL1157395.1 ArsC family reductase [Shewanella inventionis]GGB58521.1 arsenate reductase [Shewanella inventionis]
MTLYGIKNCDTVRKARKWLEAEKIDYTFHDFRENGLTADTVSQWVSMVGWETLFNKRSTSFRELSDSDKSDLTQDKAIALMVQFPTLVKRPVLVKQNSILIGFKAEQYQAWFA